MALSKVWNDLKLKLTAQALGEPLPHFIGHLECLWSTAYEHYLPDGKMPTSHVETAAQWEGDVGTFLKILKLHGLVRTRYGMAMLHNFRQHAPAYVLKRIERMKLDGMECRDNVGRTADIGRRTGDNVGRTAPYPTQPNPTQHNQEEPQLPCAVDTARPTSQFFETFWQAWPPSKRKVAKRKCLEIWKRKKLDGMAASVMAALAQDKVSQSWKDGFDPLVTTWLNGERYDRNLAEVAGAKEIVPTQFPKRPDDYQGPGHKPYVMPAVVLPIEVQCPKCLKTRAMQPGEALPMCAKCRAEYVPIPT